MVAADEPLEHFEALRGALGAGAVRSSAKVSA